MSTSWVCVNCAVACKDSRVFFAVICRIRLAFWVVPRRCASAGAGVGAAAAGALAGACRAGSGFGGSLLGLGSGEHVLLADAAADTGALDCREVDVVLGGQFSHQRGDVGTGLPGRGGGGFRLGFGLRLGLGLFLRFRLGFRLRLGFGFGSGLGSGFGSGLGAGFSGAAAPAAPILASSPPTATVSSSSAVIASSVPATGDGISVSTLSVDTSTSGSSTSTVSPTFFSQRVTVPSVTDSPSSGISTGLALSFGRRGRDGLDSGSGSALLGGRFGLRGRLLGGLLLFGGLLFGGRRLAVVLAGARRSPPARRPPRRCRPPGR